MMRSMLCATTMLSALSFAGEAWAQQGGMPLQPPATAAEQPATTAEPATADQSAGGTALQEIVVTAQRRSENLQKVPIVVTSVSGEQLKQSGIANLAQINVLTPGLTLRQSDGSVQTSIRGVGTSIGGGENTAAVYIDDVYLPLQRDALRELPDVEQIAILKGPQGTLFGRNATAGVIQISTLQPTQDFHLSADASYSNYQTVSAEGFVTGGLADDLAGSLSVRYDHQGEGYGHNLITGNGATQLHHSLVLRGKLLLTPDDRTKITLAGDYLDRNANLHSLHPTPGTAFAFPQGPLGSRRDYYSQIDSTYAIQSGGASLRAEHRFDFATLRSISAYRKSDARSQFDAIPQGFPIVYVGFPRQPSHSFSQELQLISAARSAFTWSAGLFYFHASNAQSPQTIAIIPGDPTVFQVSTFGREITNSVAAYAQADIRVLPRTTLTVGGRYTYEKRNIDGRVDQIPGGVLIPGAPVSQSITAKKPTWRIALNHQLTDDVMIYASYNRGFKSGGFNLSGPSQPGYLPERLDAYEVGLKSELFDHRLRLNVGGFYYNYDNIQVTQFKIVQFITNGAKARIYGLDADFQARLSPRFTLSGGVSIISPKFTDYPDAVGATPNPVPPGGVTPKVFDASGNQLPGAQKFTGTLIADYKLPVSFGEFDLNTVANYNSRYYFEPDNFIRQGSYTMLDASLRWTSNDKRLYLSVWGRNLTNRLIKTGGATLVVPGVPIATASLVAYEAPPRTYGVTAGVKF